MQHQSEGVEDDTPSKWHPEKEKVGVAVLTSDKIEFKTKKVTGDKDGH